MTSSEKGKLWQNRGIIRKMCEMPDYTSELLHISYDKITIINYNTQALFLPSSTFAIRRRKTTKTYYIEIL